MMTDQEIEKAFFKTISEANRHHMEQVDAQEAAIFCFTAGANFMRQEMENEIDEDNCTIDKLRRDLNFFMDENKKLGSYWVYWLTRTILGK